MVFGGDEERKRQLREMMRKEIPLRHLELESPGIHCRYRLEF